MMSQGFSFMYCYAELDSASIETTVGNIKVRNDTYYLLNVGATTNSLLPAV